MTLLVGECGCAKWDFRFASNDFDDFEYSKDERIETLNNEINSEIDIRPIFVFNPHALIS